MPARYTVDAAQKLVWAEYFGAVTDDDVLEQQECMRADADVRRHYAKLADCSQVESISVTPDALRRVVQLWPDPSRFAVVAPQAVVYGLARMLQVYLPNATNETYRIFTNVDDACEWLGVVLPERESS